MDYKYLDIKTISQIKSLKLRARLLVEGFFSGFHKSPYKGFSVEFSDYRTYQPGDDIRSIDWRVYGRTDRFYIREFEEETNLQLILLIDASASMSYAGPDNSGLSKFDYCATTAAALAYLAFLQKDAVGMVTFGESVRSIIPPRFSTKHLHIILSQLQNEVTEGETDIYTVLSQVARRVKRRALFAVFTDLWDEPESVAAGLSALKGSKHDVILFHLLHHSEIEFPFREQVKFKDMEDGDILQVDSAKIRQGYIEALEEFTSEYKTRLGERNIDYVPLTTATPPGDALMGYLGKRSSLI